MKSKIVALFSALTWSLSAISVSVMFMMKPFNENIYSKYGGLFLAGFGELIALSVITILYVVKGRFNKSFFNRKFIYIMVGALLSGPVGMSFYYLSIQFIGQSFSDSLTGIYPILVVAFAGIFLKERYSFKVYISIFIATCGIVIILFSGIEGEINFSGIIFSLTTAICWSMEALFLDYTLMDSNIDWKIAIYYRQLTTGLGYLLIVFPVLIFLQPKFPNFIVEISDNIPLIVFLIINGVAIITSYSCFYLAIDLDGAGLPAILNSTYMVFTPLLSFLIYPLLKMIGIVNSNYSLNQTFYYAIPFIMVGVICVIYFSNPKGKKNKPI